jgi:hypothetical protein
MSIRRTRAVASVAIILAIVATPILSGCSVRSLVENATGGQVDIGGKSVPKDFPAEVPLIDGEVIYGGGLGSDENQVWNVTIKVADLAAFDTITASFTDAGFTSLVSGDGDVDGGVGGAFENEKYGLLVVVSEDGNKGFIANYTVTTKAP